MFGRHLKRARFPEMGSWAWVHELDAIKTAVERASHDPEFHSKHPGVRYFDYSLFLIARVSCLGLGWCIDKHRITLATNSGGF